MQNGNCAQPDLPAHDDGTGALIYQYPCPSSDFYLEALNPRQQRRDIMHFGAALDLNTPAVSYGSGHVLHSAIDGAGHLLGG